MVFILTCHFLERTVEQSRGLQRSFVGNEFLLGVCLVLRKDKTSQPSPPPYFLSEAFLMALPPHRIPALGLRAALDDDGRFGGGRGDLEAV